MEYTLTEILWFFIVYAVAGWVFETAYAAIKKKRFINRGILNGPVCVVYGFGAVLISGSLSELRGNYFFLFLGCAILSTLIEWFTGHILERLSGERWWDYSKMRYNIDGYVSLQISAFWGVLGVLAIEFVNPLLTRLLHVFPKIVMRVFFILAFALLFVDALGSLVVLTGQEKRGKLLARWNANIGKFTSRMGRWITLRIMKRMERAYFAGKHPEKKAAVRKEKSTVFAKGCGFYKLFWLFFIGSFLGAVIEIIFCKLTTQRWMSRSSLVWGQFSLVWGLGIGFFTALLYRYRDRRDGILFLLGTLLGGCYEYICSVFTEKVFGTVFWDYSHIPFNLGGRINLLYCFFWGIASVLWFKKAYPVLSKLIEKIPKKVGIAATWVLLAFMVVNAATSVAALVRYHARYEKLAPANAVESYIDRTYPDTRMKAIYPNAIKK